MVHRVVAVSVAAFLSPTSHHHRPFLLQHEPFSFLRCESSSNTNDEPFLLPVGIFVDLDNVGPQRSESLSRRDIQHFVQPLQRFATNIVGGRLDTFQAFGNLATRRYQSPEERDRWAEIQLGGYYDDNNDWDRESSHTGFDAAGILRCGVCGTRIKLNKKDKAEDLTLQRKLEKHMKMLHDREEAKRRTWARQSKKGMSEREKQKSRKYRAAQVDARRAGKRNQLFTILRENGVTCRSAENVDKALIRAAQKWKKSIPSRTIGSDDYLLRGCLVVYSQDSDFCGLLEQGRRENFLVVSATPESRQTQKLQAASDLVLLEGGRAIPEAYSLRGVQFKQRRKDAWQISDE